jgi:hypothetical protein
MICGFGYGSSWSLASLIYVRGWGPSWPLSCFQRFYLQLECMVIVIIVHNITSGVRLCVTKYLSLEKAILFSKNRIPFTSEQLLDFYEINHVR